MNGETNECKGSWCCNSSPPLVGSERSILFNCSCCSERSEHIHGTTLAHGMRSRHDRERDNMVSFFLEWKEDKKERFGTHSHLLPLRRSKIDAVVYETRIDKWGKGRKTCLLMCVIEMEGKWWRRKTKKLLSEWDGRGCGFGEKRKERVCVSVPNVSSFTHSFSLIASCSLSVWAAFSSSLPSSPLLHSLYLTKSLWSAICLRYFLSFSVTSLSLVLFLLLFIAMFTSSSNQLMIPHLILLFLSLLRSSWLDVEDLHPWSAHVSCPPSRHQSPGVLLSFLLIVLRFSPLFRFVLLLSGVCMWLFLNLEWF